LAATAALVGALWPSSASATVAAPGALDPTFGNGGVSLARIGAWVGADAVAVQRDGKIVAVGVAYTGSTYEFAVARMLRDGRLDPKFGRQGWVTVTIGNVAFANALAIQPDGRIVIAGTGTVNGALRFVAVRLRPNGKLDRRFGRMGVASVSIGSASIANAVAVRPDGRIVLAGTARLTYNEFAVVQLNRNGTLNRSFGAAGVRTVSRLPGADWGMVLQPDGSVVVAGPGSTPQVPATVGGVLGVVLGLLPTPPPQVGEAFMAARVRTDGTLDPSFGDQGIVTISPGAGGVCEAIALRPDGRLVLTGNALSLSGASIVATVSLMPSGALDPSFGSGGVATEPGGGVNAVALQKDGKIVLAGVGAAAVRLEPNGAPDYGFGTQGAVVHAFAGGGAAANGVSIQRDGKIVLAGIDTENLSVFRLIG
jgi:uncharacterized delta-60 repeat protein